MTFPISERRTLLASSAPTRRLTPIDRLTLLYAAFTTGVACAQLLGWRHGGIPHELAGTVLGSNLLLFVAAGCAPGARCPRSRGFVAEWYPAIVLVGLYAVVGLLNDPTPAPAPSFDVLVQGWELRLFGAQLAVELPRAFPHRGLAEFLAFCYLSFYAVCIATPAVLWATGRRAAARQAIFAILMTFFACYAIFLLFPVAGPPYSYPWAEGPAWSGPLVRAVRHVITTGDSFGTAFPSSHVAASAVALVYAFRGWRTLGWLLLVPVAGILVAVVYLQIHYAVDAVSGLLMAAAAALVTPRFCPLDPAPSDPQ